MGDADGPEAVLLNDGFGANTNHWRFNQPVLAEQTATYAIDLTVSGTATNLSGLKDEQDSADCVHYGFDLWGHRVPISLRGDRSTRAVGG